MIVKSAIATAAMLLLSVGSGIALAQNGPRGNCPNPGQNCPRKGQCMRQGQGQGAKSGAGGGMQRGRGMANCPRR